jgi:hypothetical protein
MPSIYPYEYIRCASAEMGRRQELAVYRSCHQVRQFFTDITLFWKFSRIATDLNLHQVTSTKSQTEKQEREILNRTRVWMICFNLDRSTATQFGKPSTIKEDLCVSISLPVACLLIFLALCVTLRIGIRNRNTTFLWETRSYYYPSNSIACPRSMISTYVPTRPSCKLLPNHTRRSSMILPLRLGWTEYV